MGEYRGRGFRIHYVQEASGHAVVFAHGLVMDHTMWAAQFEELPDTFRCIAWDMRGHGFSASAGGNWTMQDLVDDLAEFVVDLHAAPCHLVGHSIGGMLAVRVALQRPELVSSLVLIDTSADAKEKERLELYRGFQQTVRTQGVDDDLVGSTLPIFYGDRFIQTDEDGVGVHTKRAKEMPQDALVQALDALLGRDSVVDRLGEIGVPALVVHGEQDRAIDMRHAETLRDRIPGATLVTVPCGHTPPLEAPDAVNEALGRFLAAQS